MLGLLPAVIVTDVKELARDSEMREVRVERITEAVAELCGRANLEADPRLLELVRKRRREAKDRTARAVLGMILKNAAAAREERLPLCQDTGMVVVWLDLGREVRLTGGELEEAVNEGVRRSWRENYFRPSVVRDPLARGNTGDNTPAVIHTRIVPGSGLRVRVGPKGFGSENAAAAAMLPPGAGASGVAKFVVERVEAVGANACPPLVIGVGVGGTLEKAALLAREALLLPLDYRNPSARLRKLEKNILDRVNRLGIGPQGLGGAPTALAVRALSYPTHIAGLPAAVNLSCHVYRHREKRL